VWCRDEATAAVHEALRREAEGWADVMRAPFEPEGAGVVFRRGRVAHVFTLWQPEGWRTVDGLALADDDGEVGEGLVVFEERACAGYTAVLASRPPAVSVFYVHRERVWGFGLVAPGANPCL
jgi:hypothetical protein